MRNKKDYYDYWSKNRNVTYDLFDREKMALKLIKIISKKGDKILDVGCGYGRFMGALSKEFPKSKIKGIDYSTKEVELAKKNGLDVTKSDFEEKTNLKKGDFDIIFSGEVIEHLFDPDEFLKKLNLLLKKSGIVVLTTPNLCAWFNRILMLFGIQPLFLEPSTKSKLIGAGFLRRFKKEANPVGHVRIFNLQAMKDLLEENGFKILCTKGAIFDQGLPRKIWFLDKIFKIRPSLSSILVIMARKTKEV